MKLKHDIYPNRAYAWVILIVIAVLFVVPFLWLLASSVDKDYVPYARIPAQPTMDNFSQVLSRPVNVSSFMSGLLMSVSTACLVVVVSLLCAYPLSRFKPKFSQPFLFGLLFLTGLPVSALIVPAYVIFFSLEWLDSIPVTVLFLTATALPYNIWMMKSFLDGVPAELEEAASIDGASTVQTITQVIVPLIIPGFFVIFIFSFLGVWSNFLVPFILLTSLDKMPPAVTIYQFFSAYGKVGYGQLAAFSIIYTAPALLLYVLAQRFMTRGFSLGGAIK
jgi:multiple sugar transport system permease protein